MSLKLIFTTLFLFATTLFFNGRSEPVEDKQALLDFKLRILNTHQLNWGMKNLSVCTSWTGISCNGDQSRVVAVRLPGKGLIGSIPINTLGRLSALEILSLRSNGLSGPIPSDFSNLSNLTYLYIQFNNFSGPLPDFTSMKNLSIVNLSENSFNGSIVPTIGNLTRLISLNLSDNFLSGEIPDLNLPTLQVLDLSHNNLSGHVPQSLRRFPNWVFSGNSLISPENSPPSRTPIDHKPKESRRPSGPLLLGIIIGSTVLAAAIIAILMIICYAMKGNNEGTAAKPEKKEKNSASSDNQDVKLMFFDGFGLAFDLEDLLRASAEVLGKGTVGTTYKAALEDGTTVAVKRLKDWSLSRREFEQQMDVIGNIRHENVAPLRAYYYSKDEKLMVYDFYFLGSIASLLHGARGRGEMPMDWETRLKIAIGSARGISHIHLQNGGKLVHGNIKSSNIFLKSSQSVCISDLGLATLAITTKPGGYKAPELVAATTNRQQQQQTSSSSSQAADVYSFGVLLLELLTGKSPLQVQGGGEEVVQLVRWVNSVVREEWTAEVFDVELLRHHHVEEDMVEMLQIGLACVAKMPDQRPKMSDVVKRIESLKRNEKSPEYVSGGSTPALTPPMKGIASSSS